jgi:hypothetical protein
METVCVLAPRADQNACGHCCDRLCYTVLQISSICISIHIDDWCGFCGDMLQAIGSDETLLDPVCCTDKAEFHWLVLWTGITAAFDVQHKVKEF